MSQKTPEYLLKKKNIILFLVFVALFSVLFFNIYKPFNSSSWTHNGDNKTIYFFLSIFFIFSGVFVLAISRTIMFQYKKKNSLPLTSFMIWIIGEIIVLSVIYSLLLSIFSPIRLIFLIFSPKLCYTFS